MRVTNAISLTQWAMWKISQRHLMQLAFSKFLSNTVIMYALSVSTFHILSNLLESNVVWVVTTRGLITTYNSFDPQPCGGKSSRREFET